MKKITAIILTLALALSMAACTRKGGSNSGTGAATGSNLTQAEIEKAADKLLKEEAKANK